MGFFEYKVIAAPRHGVRTKGVKGPADRFAGAMENTINILAEDGWEYVRAESLPVDERHGITMRKTEIYQNVLVFRRPVEIPGEAAAPIPTLVEDEPDAEVELPEGNQDELPEDEDDATEADTEDTEEATKT